MCPKETKNNLDKTSILDSDLINSLSVNSMNFNNFTPFINSPAGASVPVINHAANPLGNFDLTQANSLNQNLAYQNLAGNQVGQLPTSLSQNFNAGNANSLLLNNLEANVPNQLELRRVSVKSQSWEFMKFQKKS